jgi:hypothetical protein
MVKKRLSKKTSLIILAAALLLPLFVFAAMIGLRSIAGSAGQPDNLPAATVAEQLADCLPKSDQGSKERCSRLLASLESVDSYDACAAAGFPIMESYPEQCALPDGRTFTREVVESAPDAVPEDRLPNQPPDRVMPEVSPQTPVYEGVACTMDAKICPDGSAVGRIPPDCEFAPCPGGSELTE